MKKIIYLLRRFISIFPNLLRTSNVYISVKSGKYVKLHSPYTLIDATIGDYTYIDANSSISYTTIGKFCSIGSNFLCGLGIHPSNGISTSPFFYSTKRQNGISICKEDKIQEYSKVYIGNDVFIGSNVTILGGITIGDGAIIGAGAVVSKDIPSYAIAVGCPIKIVRYRFDEGTRMELNDIQWWNLPSSKFVLVEKYFFDIKEFIRQIKNIEVH